MSKNSLRHTAPRRGVGGWTQTYVNWQQGRRNQFYAEFPELAVAETVLATVDPRVAQAALAVDPFAPLADLMVGASRMLALLDLDEAELMLALWRAERDEATV